MKDKLKNLLTQWPDCGIATSRWLGTLDIGPQWVKAYVENGWLVPLGVGAFARPNFDPSWLAGVCALQDQLGLSVHVAAKTALELHGHVHFVPRVNGSVAFLFSTEKRNLPKWFRTYSWDRTVRYKVSHLFTSDVGDETFDYIEHAAGFQVKLSSRERAALEVCSLVTSSATFEEAYQLLETLPTLRAEVVKNHLEHCKSIKAKRVFLVIADRLHYRWFEDLSLARVELGEGVRSVVKGGVYDDKYQIMVPENLGSS